MSGTTRRALLRRTKAGSTSQRARVLVPALVDALTDTSADVMRASMETLALIGPEGCAAESALRVCARDLDERVRSRAALALWCVCCDAPAAIDISSRLMKSSDPSTRAEAVGIVSSMGVDGSAGFPFVRDLANDGDGRVRMLARQVIEAEKARSPRR